MQVTTKTLSVTTCCNRCSMHVPTIGRTSVDESTRSSDNFVLATHLCQSIISNEIAVKDYNQQRASVFVVTCAMMCDERARPLRVFFMSGTQQHDKLRADEHRDANSEVILFSRWPDASPWCTEGGAAFFDWSVGWSIGGLSHFKWYPRSHDPAAVITHIIDLKQGRKEKM